MKKDVLKSLTGKTMKTSIFYHTYTYDWKNF